jgi:hypothetical protein
MPSPAEARQLYEDLQSHTDIVGAYTFATAREEARFRFGPRLIAVNADCVVDQNPFDAHLLIHAPSPWHAAIHLLVENRGWLSGRYGFGRKMALLYRGQTKADWSLIPAVGRPGADVEQEILATRAFVSIAERMYCRQTFTNFAGTPSLNYLSDDLLVPKALHVATAQHFGIATPLLDFTTDPAVAVWFACRGATNSTGAAAVFAIPSEIASTLGVSFLLPHPYVRRLYRQRGVFVKPPAVDRDDLKAIAIEVRFVPDPAFQVLRSGRTVELLANQAYDEGDEWWAEQVRMSRALAAGGQVKQLTALPMTDEGFLTFLEMTDSWEMYPEWMILENRQHIVRDSTRDLLQMLLSLTTALDGITPRVSKSTMRLIGAHSALSVGSMVPLLRAYVDSMPGAAPLRVAAEAMLAELDEVVPDFSG